MSLPMKPEEALEQVAHAVRSIRYGTVQVVIQDARVIQIEKTEKIRLKSQADQTAGGHSRQIAGTDQTAGGEGPEGGLEK